MSHGTRGTQEKRSKAHHLSRAKPWQNAQIGKLADNGGQVAATVIDRLPGVFVLLVCVAITLLAVPVYAESGSWEEQPPNLTGFIFDADGIKIYDFTFAKMVNKYLTNLDTDNMTFIFTQCHSGGMLDELRASLDASGNVALMSSCAFDETSTVSTYRNPMGFSETVSYYVDLIVEGFMLSDEYALTMGELAERTDKRNPEECPEVYQWIFLDAAAKVRLGQTAQGKVIAPNQRFAVLFVGEKLDNPHSDWAWSETKLVYDMLVSVGFTAENITVLASTSRGTAPEADGPGTRQALQGALKVLSESTEIDPGACFFFWTTGHGDQIGS